MITMQNVRKTYGNFTFEISMELPEGQILGLIGKNGAGKSTAIKLILGLCQAEEGTVTVLGSDSKELSEKVKQDIGVSLAESGFSGELTVNDVKHILKKMYHSFDENYFIKQSENLKLPMNKKIKEFSTGMKAKLRVLTAMTHHAKLLIMDEPTAGLDPAGRDEILDLVARMHRERNMTVILVSHSMEDVAKYVERIIVMNHGQVMFDDTPKEVFRHYKELETIGLAAPQVTYLMHELKEHGLSVDTEARTVEEARASLMQALTGIDSGRSDVYR